MSTVAVVFFGVAACVALAGCERAPSDLPVAADPAAVAPTRPPSAAAAPLPGASARYACEGGHFVETTAQGRARVTLADGRIVDLDTAAADAGVAGSYAGEALQFTADTEGGGILVQDEDGPFACAAQ